MSHKRSSAHWPPKNMAVFESQFSSLWILHPRNLTIVLLKVPKTAINNAVCYMKPNHLELIVTYQFSNNLIRSLHCQIKFSASTIFSLPDVLRVCFWDGVVENSRHFALYALCGPKGYGCFAVLVNVGYRLWIFWYQIGYGFCSLVLNCMWFFLKKPLFRHCR